MTAPVLWNIIDADLKQSEVLQLLREISRLVYLNHFMVNWSRDDFHRSVIRTCNTVITFVRVKYFVLITIITCSYYSKESR